MSTSRAKRTRRHARLAIIVGVFVFLLAQCVAALLVEVWFPGWREAQLQAKVQNFQERAKTGDTVLFLGPSRTSFGIKVGVIEPELSQACGRPIAALNYGVAEGMVLTSERSWRHL